MPVPDANLQPIAAAEVAAAVADAAVSDPADGVIEIARPERIKMADLIRRVLTAENATEGARAPAGYRVPVLSVAKLLHQVAAEGVY